MSDSLVIHSPANGDLVGEVPITPVPAVAEVVGRAREAQKAWAARTFAGRRAALLDVRQHVLESADTIVDWLAKENGKPRQEGLMHEVMAQLALLTYFADNAERILAPHPIAMELTKQRASYLHYPARGVIGIIGPWNFPVNLTMGGAAMALAAGNAAVIKPSEFTPNSVRYVRQLYIEAGIPQDLLGALYGYGDVGAALCREVDMVEFTGSVSTGRKVAGLCAERLIPCVLELGGKGACLVLPDADFGRAVDGVLWGGFANAGQVCASIERLLLHTSIHDRFVDALVPRVKALRVGDATKSADIDVGPLVNQRQLEIVEELVADAVARGARVACGGRRVDGPGLFYEPTVLLDCTPEMAILNRETFGPVVPVLRVADEAAMVAEANRSHLGLVSYVFTRDEEKGRRIAETIESGTVMVNDVLATQAMAETPWAGVKQSGLGCTHSDEGLRHMCQARHVNYGILPWLKRELWWYPYAAKDLPLFKRALGALYGRGLKRFFRAA